MLNAVLDYHLQQQNTTVSHDMKSNLCVDNVISGGATEEEVVRSNSVKLNAIVTEDGVNDDSQSVNMLGL